MEDDLELDPKAWHTLKIVHVGESVRAMLGGVRVFEDADRRNRWSGGLGFLNHGYSGSEVSIEPDGAVYPCCVKTKLPIGSLLDEPLIEILDSLAGEPAYEAINAGHPERMGIAHGWNLETFLAKSRTLTPAGQPYQNACIGCDRFHQEVLGEVIERARLRRHAARLAAATPAAA